jgi:hypothetical protein
MEENGVICGASIWTLLQMQPLDIELNTLAIFIFIFCIMEGGSLCFLVWIELHFEKNAWNVLHI